MTDAIKRNKQTKIEEQTGLFKLGMTTSLEKRKLNSNLLNLIKKFDLESIPACVEAYICRYIYQT